MFDLMFTLSAATAVVQLVAGCDDPLARILEAMECIEGGDSACATDAYADDFVKLHNGVDTNTKIDDDFWAGTFMLVDIAMDYDEEAQVNTANPNQASLSYAETVHVTDGSNFGLPASNEFPWNVTFVQHERALVTVDDECKITMWDQTGDDEEQAAVEDAINMLLCSIGFYGPDECDTAGDLDAGDSDEESIVQDSDADGEGPDVVEETASDGTEEEEEFSSEKLVEEDPSEEPVEEEVDDNQHENEDISTQATTQTSSAFMLDYLGFAMLPVGTAIQMYMN